MPSPARNIAIAAVVAIALIGGYVAWSAKEKRAQKQAIAALVGQASQALAKSLDAVPGKAEVAAAEAAAQGLGGTATSRHAALARAADQYLAEARIIVQRSAEAGPLAQKAAASRKALASHLLVPRGRDGQWILRATELKKEAEQDHADYERMSGALADLLDGAPKTQAPLSKEIDPALLIPDERFAAASRRVREDAMRASAEIDKARRLGSR